MSNVETAHSMVAHSQLLKSQLLLGVPKKCCQKQVLDCKRIPYSDRTLFQSDTEDFLCDCFVNGWGYQWPTSFSRQTLHRYVTTINQKLQSYNILFKSPA